MTVSEALQSINSFPIPDLFIEKVGIDRVLDITVDYTAAISITSAYELATADVYLFLYGQPSITEQEVGINNTQAIKQGFLDIANGIYASYDDAKFTGGKYGFIGGSWNG